MNRLIQSETSAGMQTPAPATVAEAPAIRWADERPARRRAPQAAGVGPVVAAALLIMLSSTVSAVEATALPALPGQHAQRFEGVIQRTASLQYLLFLPKGYDPGTERRWPLLVFLHGAGERGTDPERVSVHGPPKLVKDRPDFPFVVASPQCPTGEVWDVSVLNAFLDDLLRRLSVDAHRVYLTGLSMGGYGSWAWAARNPERFAAVAPICGGGDPISVWLSEGARREVLSKLPLWVFHGAKDPVVSLSESQRMVDAYKRLGNEARLTVYPDAGHDSWTQAYATQGLFDWFLQHSQP